MNKLRMIRKILSTLIATLLMIVAYQNCGDSAGNGYTSHQSGQSSGDGQPAPGGNGDIQVLADTKTASIVSANRTLDSMVSCLGAVRPSQAAKDSFIRNKGSLSVEGSANSVTTPMLAAFSSIAAEVCNDVVEKEKNLASAQRRLFSAIDFASSPADNIGAVSDVASRISRSCWGREANSSEISIIQNAMSQAYGSENNDEKTHEQMVFLCAGMVGAFASIEM